MKTTLKNRNILVYYDGIQLFEAVDIEGRSYIFVAVEEVDQAIRYLCETVSDEGNKEWFTADIVDETSIQIELKHISKKDIPKEWLSKNSIYDEEYMK